MGKTRNYVVGFRGRARGVKHRHRIASFSAGTHFMQVSKWLGHSTFTLTAVVMPHAARIGSAGELGCIRKKEASWGKALDEYKLIADEGG